MFWFYPSDYNSSKHVGQGQRLTLLCNNPKHCQWQCQCQWDKKRGRLAMNKGLFWAKGSKLKVLRKWVDVIWEKGF